MPFIDLHIAITSSVCLPAFPFKTPDLPTLSCPWHPSRDFSSIVTYNYHKQPAPHPHVQRASSTTKKNTMADIETKVDETPISPNREGLRGRKNSLEEHLKHRPERAELIASA
jgi:hypothetical protein